jgi:hypothetical protein
MISEHAHTARNLSHINMIRNKNPQATSINYDQHNLPYIPSSSKLPKIKTQNQFFLKKVRNLKEKKPYKNYSQYCSIDLPET